MSQSQYDPFFSRSMELPLVARAFFRQYLPAYTQPLSDFSTLARIDRTNTSADLKKRHRDIAYEMMMKGGSKLLACVEQQSQPDIAIPARFLVYSGNNLDYELKKHQKIPLLINLLFYNGEVSPYPYLNTLQAYYDDPAAGIQELALRFHLIDVTQISDQELLQHGHCAPMELLLKHGRDGNFELEAAAYRDVYQACIEAVGDDYIITMLDYATSLNNEEAGRKIYHFIETVLTNKEDTIMTYGERLQQRGMQQGMQRGMQQGMQRGMQQGIQTVAQNMLQQLHLSPEVVQQATGLDREAIAKLVK